MINTRYSHPFSQDVDELIWDNKNIKRRNNQKAVLSATMTLNTYIYRHLSWMHCSLSWLHTATSRVILHSYHLSHSPSIDADNRINGAKIWSSYRSWCHWDHCIIIRKHCSWASPDPISRTRRWLGARDSWTLRTSPNKRVCIILYNVCYYRT